MIIIIILSHMIERRRRYFRNKERKIYKENIVEEGRNKLITRYKVEGILDQLLKCALVNGREDAF